MERVSLRLEGTGGRGNVSLDDFVTELAALRSSLEQTDRSLSGGRRSVEWEIVDLRHASPATVVLEGHRITDEPWAQEAQGRVLGEFVEAVRALDRDETLPPRYEAPLLNSLKTLAAPVRSGDVRATLTIGNQEVEITPAIGTSAERQVEAELESEGRYKGLLEFLNIHGRKSEFRIYPPAGPNFVTCQFEPELLHEARAAVGSNVIVTGTLRYKARSPFPNRITVASIAVIPPNEELPTSQELRGLVPDMTGGLASEEWLRQTRGP